MLNYITYFLKIPILWEQWPKFVLSSYIIGPYILAPALSSTIADNIKTQGYRSVLANFLSILGSR